MISQRDTISLKNIGAIEFREVSGLVEIGEIYQRDTVGLKRVWAKATALSVSVPSSVSGAAASASSVSILTNRCTATVSGGTAPYTYSWAKTGGAGTWVITNPIENSTYFRTETGIGIVSATFAVTVTDSTGQVVTSSDVTATVTNYGSLS